MAYFRCAPIAGQSGNGLPPGYKRCNYLQSSGSQYIDTSVPNKWTDNIRMTIDIALDNFAKYCTLIGLQDFVAFEQSLMLNILIDRYAIRLFRNSSQALEISNIGSDKKYSIGAELGNNGTILLVDNNVVGTLGEKIIHNQQATIFLMAENSYGHYDQVRYYTSGKLYGSKIIVDNIDKFNGIPCLDSTGKPCMFDVVTKKPFHNLGKGEFGYELMDGTYVAPI